jgi:hypothetical protein
MRCVARALRIPPPRAYLNKRERDYRVRFPSSQDEERTWTRPRTHGADCASRSDERDFPLDQRRGGAAQRRR